jgi:hypothetical protein
MELVGLLSKIIKENVNVKKILLEYPESTVKKLLDKYTKETDDTEDEIKKVISDFERFKSSFDNEDKDIFKHSYERLKQLVADKYTKQKTKKDLEGLAQEFVTKHKGVDLQLVKTNHLRGKSIVFGFLRHTLGRENSLYEYRHHF